MSAVASTEDVAAVLRAVEDLGEATGRDDLIDRILRHTMDLIPNEMSSFNWMAPGTVSAVIRPELDPEAFERYNAIIAAHWHENPLADHFRRTGDTRARTWLDVEAGTGWRSGVLYREMYEPLGVSHQLVVRLPSPPGVVAGLACNGDRPFDQRDRDVLTLLGRHVAARLGAVSEHSALRVALDLQGWRTLLVDDGGRLVAPDDDPDRLLSDGRELHPALARLVPPHHPGARRSRLVPGDPQEVDLRGEAVVAFLVPSSVPPHLLFVRPVATVGRRPVDAAVLRSHGLSLRQAEVAARLASGATNKQIARELDITVGTVKKHLQAVFAVLDVETRAAAAAMVARLVG
ncbi:MAG: helix-turn-helix transcriptional regulator [Iamia sp.]